MTKRYYEHHITLEAPPEDKLLVKGAVEARGWKFSCIDGDPVMGPGIKMYATRHYNERIGYASALQFLHDVADGLAENFTVTRRKVELVLYDDRSSKVKLGACDGLCPECHLDDLVPQA